MGGNEPQQSPGNDSLDEVFSALGHRHRRRILSRLFEKSPRYVEELVAAGPEDVDRDRLEVELHHIHLPKLEDAGFVEWEVGLQVRRGPKFDAVASVIALFERHGNHLPGKWP